MIVKILKDFDYSLDGINPVSFKKGKVTDRFNDAIARNLIDRKLVSAKGPKPKETEEEKAKRLKLKEGNKAQADKEKAEKRVEELIEAGAELDNGVLSLINKSDDQAEPIQVDVKDILATNEEEWDVFVKHVAEIKAENDLMDQMTAEDNEDPDENSEDNSEEGNQDNSFDENDDLGNESETTQE